MTKSIAIRTAERRAVAIQNLTREYVEASKAVNTQKAYSAGWRDFLDFCAGQHFSPLPASPETVAAYLVSLSEDQRVSTLQVKLSAIGFYHRAAKQVDPAADEQVRILMDGIRHKRGTAPVKKAPLTLDELRPLLAALPANLRGKRDRALLLIGYACAFIDSAASLIACAAKATSSAAVSPPAGVAAS